MRNQINNLLGRPDKHAFPACLELNWAVGHFFYEVRHEN